jgi:dimethylamine corrinoid protein
MSQGEMYARLSASVIAGEGEEVVAVVREALEGGMAPLEVIERGLKPGMAEVGEKFRRYEIYLPEMMMAADAWEQAMKVLEPELGAGGESREKVGRVVMGTVRGDIHCLGKDIVVAMLRVNGFEVYDLGVDVAASAFVDKAEEVGADVIGVSALMTTTMPQQRNVIEHLRARGVRDRYFVIVGGGCTNQSWADEIGADAYGETAGDAVMLALKGVDRAVV